MVLVIVSIVLAAAVLGFIGAIIWALPAEIPVAAAYPSAYAYEARDVAEPAEDALRAAIREYDEILLAASRMRADELLGAAS